MCMIEFLMHVDRLSCMLVEKIGFLMKLRVYACIWGSQRPSGSYTHGRCSCLCENKQHLRMQRPSTPGGLGRCPSLPRTCFLRNRRQRACDSRTRALSQSAQYTFPREKMKESLCIGLICFFLYSYMSLIPWYALIIASKCKYMGNIYALLVAYIFMIALCICLSALYTIFIYTWYMVKDNDTRYMYTDICIYG